ncbi:MAG: alpha/beta hydrolase [bacterium]|nr:alpha/beta hydrolase [bacterium]
MEKTISINGRATHYWTYGRADKPLLIMVHGFRGTHHGLLPVVEYLDDFYIIIPDLPGFGNSQTIPRHDLASYVDWLNEFCKSIRDDRQLDILGHSFGSIIVSHYAVKFPDQARRVVLVNPISTSALKGSKQLATKAAVLYYWLGDKLPSKLSRSLLSNPAIVKIMSLAMTQSRDPDMRHFIHDQHKSYFSNFQTTASVLEAFKTSTANIINTNIKQPTLLIAGDSDMIAPLKGQLAAADKIVDCRLVTIADVGHLIHYEKPDRAALAIRDFLS